MQDSFIKISGKNLNFFQLFHINERVTIIFSRGVCTKKAVENDNKKN